MEYFFNGFGVILQPIYILYMFTGVTLGVLLGAIPGLTGGLGIALMLPFTFYMDSLTALVFLLSIYSGGLFGGSISAITINTPGSPPNFFTMLDGNPMFQRGEGGMALGIALMSSVFGGLIGAACLVIICEPLASLALKFGPGEMVMVMFFGISCIGGIAKRPLKGFYAGLFGLLLGTVGTSVVGSLRGTYGSIYLMEGIPLTPALLGFVALPRVLELVKDRNKKYNVNKKDIGLNAIFKGFRHVFVRPIQVIICSLLGVIIGIVPAAGSGVAGALTYNQSKQWMKKGKLFGTGVPEGIIAVETANNASEGGALATMFVLGLPGSVGTAMLIGALILQGWAPGPKLFFDNKEIIYWVFASEFIQMIVMLIVGIFICLLASYIVKIPNNILFPCIISLMLMGSFARRYIVFDMGLLLFFGIIVLFMRKTDFPAMPLVLGFMLGRITDANLIRIYQSFDSFFEIFKSPIVVTLFLIGVFSLFVPFLLKLKELLPTIIRNR